MCSAHEARSKSPLLRRDICDLFQWSWRLALFLPAMYSCHWISYIWTDQSRSLSPYPTPTSTLCANSGRSARQRIAQRLYLTGTKRKWQGNRHSVSIAMVAQAWHFIPRLMGWCLKLKVPDWEKQVPVLLKKEVAEDDVNRQRVAEGNNKSIQQPGCTLLTWLIIYHWSHITKIRALQLCSTGNLSFCKRWIYLNQHNVSLLLLLLLF